MTNEYTEAKTSSDLTAGSREAESPGRRTLSERLPVQRRAKATGDHAPAPSAPSGVEAAAATPTGDDPFALHLGGGAPASGGAAGNALDHAATSKGEPLPEPLQSKFGASLGADLSGVRIHAGEASADAAQSVNARAFATGQDIYVGSGHYDPGSRPGEELLAHEVAHTVQQRGGGAPSRQNRLEVSEPGDPLEVEADHAAGQMVQGAPASVVGGGSAPQIARITQTDGQVGSSGAYAADQTNATARIPDPKNRAFLASLPSILKLVNPQAVAAYGPLLDAWATLPATPGNFAEVFTGLASACKTINPLTVAGYGPLLDAWAGMAVRSEGSVASRFTVFVQAAKSIDPTTAIAYGPPLDAWLGAWLAATGA